MYIIYTYNQQVQIDEDELYKLDTDANLIMFKQGMVNPKNITCILPDTGRKSQFLKGVHEEQSSVNLRIKADKLTDVFSDVRSAFTSNKEVGPAANIRLTSGQ